MIRKSLFPLAVLLILSSFAQAAVYEKPPEPGDPMVEAGNLIELDNGQKLQLFAEDNIIVGYFVDAEGLILEPSADSILFMVDDPGHKDHKWRTVLEPSGKTKMTSSRRIYGPYNFRSRIIIRFPDGQSSAFSDLPLNLEKNIK